MPRVDDGKALGADALRGATIVVTRPVGTGAALARGVRKAGGIAVLLPGLRLRAKDNAPRGSGLPWTCGIFLFTSPAAVRFAFASKSRRLPRRALVAAVGEGTRAALARLGIDAQAPVDRADSEGLLALPALGDVRGQRIALVGAAGGRDLIASNLTARGAEVEAVHVYERVPPRLTRRHFDALAAARDPLLTLVSSGEALANLVALLPDAALARLRGQALLVSRARLGELAQAAGFADVVIAPSALPRDLLATAARRLARHRL